MNERAMREAMKRMGIKQEEIAAEQVVIKTADKEIIVSNPRVTKINMMGQETFQVVGEISERSLAPDISDDDIDMVMEQTGASREKAAKAIENSEGDLAKAIISLNKKGGSG